MTSIRSIRDVVGRGSVVVAVAMLLLLSACHSSRNAVKGSSGTSTPVAKPDYDEMRQEMSERRYDIKQIRDLIAEASSWLGVPYLYSGHSHEGTDCSGLVMEVYLKTLDVKLPRSSAQQQQFCSAIGREALLPGDLLFFATGRDPQRVSHVGLYIGDGDMIHASSSRGVIVSHLSENYYTNRFLSAGRVDIVARLYAEAARKQVDKANREAAKAADQSVKASEEAAQATQQSVKAPDKPLQLNIDDIITEKIDSIYTPFFD